MVTEQTDDEIIKRVLGGEVNQYAVLIQRYNRLLYRVCRGYLQQEAEIEDIMQDAYLRAFEKLGTFEGRSGFGTWITRILINEALQRLKVRNKQSVITSEETPGNMNPVDPSSPESKALHREFRGLLENSIESLPPAYRMVFMLREIERMNVVQTAEALSISESNVKVRLNRAKEMLRKSLLQSFPLDELYEFNLVRCSRVANNVLMRIRERRLMMS
jgi:RNA polymerase sigma factor (sigma-70 family)